MSDEQVISRGERTQVEIIEAAYRLFVEQGYHGTSMRQVARRAGVALGGIYNHFPSKEDIFKQVLLQYHPFHIVIASINAAQGDNVEELVRDAARRMVSSLENQLDFLNLMFIELVEFNAQHIGDIYQTIIPRVLEFGTRLTAEPKGLRPIPMPLLLRAFIGIFFSFFITEQLVSSQMPAEMKENALEAFIDIYLHGILAPNESVRAEDL